MDNLEEAALDYSQTTKSLEQIVQIVLTGWSVNGTFLGMQRYHFIQNRTDTWFRVLTGTEYQSRYFYHT